jgi:hypothetical protein
MKELTEDIEDGTKERTPWQCMSTGAKYLTVVLPIVCACVGWFAHATVHGTPDPIPSEDIELPFDMDFLGPWPYGGTGNLPPGHKLQQENQRIIEKIKTIDPETASAEDIRFLIDSLYPIILPAPFDLERLPIGYSHLHAMDMLRRIGDNAHELLFAALEGKKAPPDPIFRILAVHGYLPAFDYAMTTLDEPDSGLLDMLRYYLFTESKPMSPDALKKWYFSNRHRLFPGFKGTWGSRMLINYQISGTPDSEEASGSTTRPDSGK